MNKLLEGEDFEEAIFHARATTRWVKLRENFELQAKELTLPLSALKGGAGNFLQWLLQVTNPMPTAKRTELLDALTKINDRWIKTIDDYHFPVVTLSDKTEPDALCTIFETLNRTGVKLSVFELLTARFWPLEINLRDLWSSALKKHSIIEDFEVDPYYVLQAIALAGRKTPSCKRSDVLNLEASDIQGWWEKVVNGLAAGLHILRDDCKIALPKWLPYQTMLAPLAATLARSNAAKTPDVGAQREKLKRWFWCAVFGQVYESSPNSKSAKDVTELEVWLTAGALPESVRSLRFDPKTLRDVTPRQRSIYRGTICLVLASGTGARDFHTRAVITGKLMNDEGIDDHHVFPDDFLLKKKGITQSRTRDCVLNRTLIDRTTNQLISNRAPSDYLAQIKKTPGFPFDEVLASHRLPTGKSSPLWDDDYAAFLTARQDLLWAEIQRATGLTEADDLEAEGAEAS